ncbi:MAG: SxtJ family membrane protein [Candidatus Binataceae bacterium]
MTDAALAPSRRELRDFGLIVGGIFAALFGVALPLLKHRAIPAWPWVVCVALVIPALAYPKALGWPHFLWQKLGFALGWINSKIVLTILFYAVLLPTGIIMRALGRDPMARQLDRNLDSYRVPSRKRPPESMDRPF